MEVEAVGIKGPCCEAVYSNQDIACGITTYMLETSISSLAFCEKPFVGEALCGPGRTQDGGVIETKTRFGCVGIEADISKDLRIGRDAEAVPVNISDTEANIFMCEAIVNGPVCRVCFDQDLGIGREIIGGAAINIAQSIGQTNGGGHELNINIVGSDVCIVFAAQNMEIVV